MSTHHVEGPFYKKSRIRSGYGFSQFFRPRYTNLNFGVLVQGFYNLIKAFMTNITFRVRNNNSTSKLHKPYNGIPQGSPLSVVLFLVAFEQITSIFNRHKDISISLYADNAFIFTKKGDLDPVKEIFSEVLQEKEQWGASSGASPSIEKCQVLHICRNHNCNFPEIVFRNKSISFTENLKFYGLPSTLCLHLKHTA